MSIRSSRRLLLPGLAGLAAAAALLACSVLPGTTAPLSTSAPPALPTRLPASPPANPSGGAATLQLVNNSGQEVCYVYISSTIGSDWGDDWLGDTETIEPGATRSFDVQAGAYDLRAEDCTSNVLGQEMGVSLTASGFTWTLTPSAGPVAPGGGATTLHLVNNSGAEICYVYISPSTETTWGEDWLGSSETIPAGGTHDFEIEAGQWDLRADDCDNENLDEEFLIDIPASGYTWVATSWVLGSGTTLQMVNNSGTEVCFVYISPTTETAWGPDRLGDSETIADGSSRSFSLSPGSWDLQAQDCDHNPLDQQMGITISGSGYTWMVP